MKYFLKILLGHEIFRSMVSRATNFFFFQFIKPSGFPFYIHNVHSLIKNSSIYFGGIEIFFPQNLHLKKIIKSLNIL